jgi:hypothetical protein
MEIGTGIKMERVAALFEKVFEAADVAVYTAYSKFGEGTRKFQTVADCVDYLAAEIKGRSGGTAFALHYADTKGHVLDRRITLKQEKCDGNDFRYTIEGWGLINIKLYSKDSSTVFCDIGANTAKRAAKWFSVYPEFQDPALWNWTAVESHLRRLKRALAALMV